VILLRRLHAASATIAVDTDVEWPHHLADPEGGGWIRYPWPPCIRRTGCIRTATDPRQSYGLSAGERTEWPGVIEQATVVCRAFVSRRLADGGPVLT
jgi:hypothetical protein